MIINVWEFLVRQGMEAEFERFNSPNGEWSQLFRPSPDYIDTSWLKSEEEALKYLTHDRWKSIEGFNRFVEQNKARYESLVKQHAQLYDTSHHIGFFKHHSE